MDKRIHIKWKALYGWIRTSLLCYRKCKGAYGISYRKLIRSRKEEYKKLSQFHNIHKGKRCFIIGTGPSLTLEDVNKLKNELTFGANTLFKVYQRTDWRATYYCVIDPDTFSNIKEELKKYHTKNLFLADNRIKNCGTNPQKFPLECSSFYRLTCPEYFGYTKFSSDITKQVYDGASVIYAALQIAVYMGFKEIYLLGVDCNYTKKEDLHGENLAYSKDYKYKWTSRTGTSMIDAFTVAKEYADQNGIHIYNAARGGMLEVFERVDLDEVLKEKG